MDRMRLLRRILTASGLALALALLGTCSNQFSLLGALTDEVKVATGKFLVVNQVTPAKNASNVNPGDRIAIEFDRAVNTETVTMSTIQFNPAVGFTFGPDDLEFNASTHTLYIDPKPYLNGPEDYTLTIGKGVKGTDGSELQNEYSWTFFTRLYPAGSVQIDLDNNAVTKEEYVRNENNVYLLLTRNDTSVTGVTGIGIGLTEAEAINDANTSPDAYPVTNSISYPLAVGTGEGLKGVYVVFIDASNNKSNAEHDTIYRDLNPPTVNAGPDILLTAAVPQVSQNATAADSGSGIKSYTWSKFSGPGTVTFGSPAAEDTTIKADTDGTYVIRLTVEDKAGWPPVFDSLTMIRDVTPPVAPTVSGTASPGTVLPSFSWTHDAAGGSGWYRYKLDSDAWSAETTAIGYTATSLSYGGHYFYVQERDAYGNWSASGYCYYFYYPSFLKPVHEATGVSRTVQFTYGSGIFPRGTTFEIWIALNPKEGFVRIASGLTSFNWTVPEPLNGKTRYYWYYVSVPLFGHGYTSPTYYFTTGVM